MILYYVKICLLIFSACALTSCGTRTPIALPVVGIPIDGLVLDDATGKPLPGAVVLILWRLQYDGRHGTGAGDIIHYEETETDSSGEFHFAEWGPVLVDDNKILWSNHPMLIVFKEGYMPYTDWIGYVFTKKRDRLVPYHPDKDINPHLKSATKEEIRDHPSIYNSMSTDLYAMSRECGWTKIPLTIKAYLTRNNTRGISSFEEKKNLISRMPGSADCSPKLYKDIFDAL